MTAAVATPVRYPAGPITPHGAYYVLNGTHPEMQLRAYDDSVVMNIMGGRAIPWRTCPESIQLKDLRGLIPPWQMVDQKGATEDGVTFIDALYDPIEVVATVLARGRDGKHTRRVARHLIDSIDAKRTSELSWTTQELGKWWANVRWFKTPPDEYTGAQKRRQQLTLTLRVDNGFWRSFDDVDEFRFVYEDSGGNGVDEFDTPTVSELGTGWTVIYSGAGGGYARAFNGEVVWVDDPRHPVLSDGRTAVFRRNGYTSTTDNQVVSVVLGTFPEWSFPDSGYTDVWCRMSTSDTPGTSGVRLRIGLTNVTLSYFVGGVETVLRTKNILPPIPGERFGLVAGYESDPRTFKIQRNGAEIMTVVEGGAGSHLGASYRGAGAGMHAGAALLTQATPAAIRRWSAGDNSSATQSGFLTRMNWGDQPMPDRYTCYGPGMFSIGDGPGSTNMIQFGPLLPNQVMQIRTDPRDFGIADLTSTPSTPQELDLYSKALADLASFATANNAPMLFKQVASIFGVQPPQGNPWTLLNGRFSTKGISPKSPGRPAQPQHVACSITNGNADSAIVAAGTPLRRYPF